MPRYLPLKLLSSCGQIPYPDSQMPSRITSYNVCYTKLLRRELVLHLARELECEKIFVTPPQGAFYFFLDFRPLKMTSTEVCERLLEEAGVALVPGSAFGNQGKGFVRMTIAASEEDSYNFV